MLPSSNIGVTKATILPEMLVIEYRQKLTKGLILALRLVRTGLICVTGKRRGVVDDSSQQVGNRRI
jgi:hypothetical protein